MTKSNDFHYEVSLTLRPREDAEYTDPDYVRATRDALAEFRERFGRRCLSVRHNTTYPKPDDYDWVEEIEAVTDERELAFSVNDWLWKSAVAEVADVSCGVSASATTPSIARARWLRVFSDF